MFYCFGCHEHGGPIDFHMKINNLSFQSSVKQLCKELGINLEDTDNTDFELFDDLTAWCQQNLKNNPSILKQLLNRDINLETINKYNIGFMPNISKQTLCQKLKCNEKSLINIGIINPNNQFNRFKQRIIFPIHDHYAQIIGFGGRRIDDNQIPKYINSPETQYFKKNTVIFNFHHVENNKDIILVEGYMDVIKLSRYGIRNAVAFMGTSFNELRLKQLTQKAQNLYICLDGDQAGQTATNKITDMCLGLLGPDCEIKVIRLPNNHDPDSFIDENDINQFKQLMARAPSLIGDILSQLKIQFPFNSTINKSRFKQHFIQKSVLIKDSEFRKAFKDLGYQFLKSENSFKQKPTPSINLDTTSWLDRVIYLIASKPKYCLELDHDALTMLQELQHESSHSLKFIGHMINVIRNNDINTLEDLILQARNKQTIKKLNALKQKSSYLSKENHILELKSSIPKLIIEKDHIQKKLLLDKAQKNNLSPSDRIKLIELIKREKNYE